MKELQVQTQLPLINGNFEEVRVSLEETLEKYKGIVVTEDSLKDCKQTKADLKKISTGIDNYRKSVKKELTKPITNFEGQCKELIALVDEVISPIDNGIKIYDEKKRQEKVKYAMDIITSEITEKALDEKYAIQLNIHSFKINNSSTLKSIKNEITEKAEFLKMQQEAEKQKIESDLKAIEVSFNSANEGYETQLEFSKYINSYHNGNSLEKVINAINSDRKMIEAAAKRAIEMEKQRLEAEARMKVASEIKEEKNETIKGEKPDQNIKQTNTESAAEINQPIVGYYTLKITHDMDHMKQLANFLKINGFKFEKLDECWN